MLPLKNSDIENKVEKVSISETLLSFLKYEKIYVAKPWNIPRKDGINKKAIGINTLKVSSNVRDIIIQYKLDKK